MFSLHRYIGLGLAFLFFSLSADADSGSDCEQILTTSRPLARAVRTLDSYSSLRFMTFNIKDFFTRETTKHDASLQWAPEKAYQKLKPPGQVAAVAKVIKENNPDIFIVQEIENIFAAKQLNKLLNNEYIPVLKEGNDSRGLDIAFFVKRDLPFYFKIETHLTEMYEEDVPLFSRDLPILTFRLDPDGPPVLAVVGYHGKSKRNSPGDPESTKLRRAQIDVAAEIVASYFSKYGDDLPLLMGGDFNTDLRYASELEPLRRLLTDSLDLVEDPIPERQRTTFVFFDKSQRKFNQLDTIMASAAFKGQVIDAYIARFYRSDGSLIGLPKFYRHKLKDPSDHLPVVVEVSAVPILRRALRH